MPDTIRCRRRRHYRRHRCSFLSQQHIARKTPRTSSRSTVYILWHTTTVLFHFTVVLLTYALLRPYYHCALLPFLLSNQEPAEQTNRGLRLRLVEPSRIRLEYQPCHVTYQLNLFPPEICYSEVSNKGIILHQAGQCYAFI